MIVALPIRLESVANKREHWAKKAKRVKEQRALVDMVLRSQAPAGMAGRLGREPATGAIVVLTRIAPRRLDDDNLQAAFKAVRDAVAAFLGLDDREARVEWSYCQDPAPRPKTYGIRIGIELT